MRAKGGCGHETHSVVVYLYTYRLSHRIPFVLFLSHSLYPLFRSVSHSLLAVPHHRSQGAFYFAGGACLMIDLQSAAVSKRLFAFLADLILASILVTGVYFLFSAILPIDRYNARYDEIRASYEEAYGVTFGLTEAEYEAMDETARAHYRAAVDAMNADEEANAAVTRAYRLTFGVFAGGIVFAVLLLEFAVPLWLGDGRTLGKKLFGLGVMRRDFVRVGAPVLFVRGLIGKGLLEVMLPAITLLSLLSGGTRLFGAVLLILFAVGEIAALVRSRGEALLHDVLAGTVVVDWASQQIFDTPEARDAYVAQLREEKAARESE